MRYLFTCAAMLCLIGLTSAARPAPAAKKTPVRKSGSKSTSKSSKSSAKKSTKSAKKTPAKTWRNRQLAPTPDRYRQIQEALAAKGYLGPQDVTGQWGPASTEALKRFQSEQNLDPNGKINSLSLIALGLGPKRENTAAPPKPPAPAQQ